MLFQNHLPLNIFLVHSSFRFSVWKTSLRVKTISCGTSNDYRIQITFSLHRLKSMYNCLPAHTFTCTCDDDTHINDNLKRMTWWKVKNILHFEHIGSLNAMQFSSVTRNSFIFSTTTSTDVTKINYHSVDCQSIRPAEQNPNPFYCSSSVSCYSLSMTLKRIRWKRREREKMNKITWKHWPHTFVEQIEAIFSVSTFDIRQRP